MLRHTTAVPGSRRIPGEEDGTPLPGRPDFPVPIRWVQGDSTLHVDDAWTSDAALQVVEVEVPLEATPGQAVIEIQHMRVTVDVDG